MQAVACLCLVLSLRTSVQHVLRSGSVAVRTFLSPLTRYVVIRLGTRSCPVYLNFMFPASPGHGQHCTNLNRTRPRKNRRLHGTRLIAAEDSVKNKANKGQGGPLGDGTAPPRSRGVSPGATASSSGLTPARAKTTSDHVTTAGLLRIPPSLRKRDRGLAWPPRGGGQGGTERVIISSWGG